MRKYLIVIRNEATPFNALCQCQLRHFPLHGFDIPDGSHAEDSQSDSNPIAREQSQSVDHIVMSLPGPHLAHYPKPQGRFTSRQIGQSYMWKPVMNDRHL